MSQTSKVDIANQDASVIQNQWQSFQKKWSLKLPFKRKTPCNNINIFRKTHREQHFRPKHARISNLHPFLQTFMVTEKQKQMRQQAEREAYTKILK